MFGNQTRNFLPFFDAHKNRGSAHLADNLMLVSESIVQTWATALQNVSLADVELQAAPWSNKLSSEKNASNFIHYIWSKMGENR